MSKQEFCHSLRWEHPQKKRYYQVLLAKDLFGDWVITKAWGAIDQAQGRVVHIYCPSFLDAKKILDDIVKTRKRRGYYLSKIQEIQNASDFKHN